MSAHLRSITAFVVLCCSLCARMQHETRSNTRPWHKCVSCTPLHFGTFLNIVYWNFKKWTCNVLAWKSSNNNNNWFSWRPIVAGCGYSGDRVDNRTCVQHGLHDSLSVTPVAHMISYVTPVAYMIPSAKITEQGDCTVYSEYISKQVIHCMYQGAFYTGSDSQRRRLGRSQDRLRTAPCSPRLQSSERGCLTQVATVLVVTGRIAHTWYCTVFSEWPDKTTQKAVGVFTIFLQYTVDTFGAARWWVIPTSSFSTGCNPRLSTVLPAGELFQHLPPVPAAILASLRCCPLVSYSNIFLQYFLPLLMLAYGYTRMALVLHRRVETAEAPAAGTLDTHHHRHNHRPYIIPSAVEFHEFR